MLFQIPRTQRDDRNAPLWLNYGTRNHGKPLNRNGANAILQRLFAKAGVDKHVYPHLFRGVSVAQRNLMSKASDGIRTHDFVLDGALF